MENGSKKRYGEVVEIEEKLSRIYLDQFGREMPDPTPIAPPVGYVKAPSMVDHVRALVAKHLSDQAAAAGAESFEEANDFDVGDDYEPETPYEALGAEGELGPLPPEVATMSAGERRALMEQRVREAQAEHSKHITPAAGGGGRRGFPNDAPCVPPGFAELADARGLFAEHGPGWQAGPITVHPLLCTVTSDSGRAEWHEVNQASATPMPSLTIRCLA